MQAVGRSLNTSKYRYGFNGKEKGAETYGEGNEYDYGFRIYDPRSGRFLSVDPLFKSYPWYTPYQFSGNMPIWAIDLDGLEEKKVTSYNRIFDMNGNIINQPTLVNLDRNDLERSGRFPGFKHMEGHTFQVTPGDFEMNGDHVMPGNANVWRQQANGTFVWAREQLAKEGKAPSRTNLEQDNEGEGEDGDRITGKSVPELSAPKQPTPAPHPQPKPAPKPLPKPISMPVNGGFNEDGTAISTELLNNNNTSGDVVRNLLKQVNTFAKQIAGNSSLKSVSVNVSGYIDASSTAELTFTTYSNIIKNAANTLRRQLIKQGVDPKKISVQAYTDLMMNKPAGQG